MSTAAPQEEQPRGLSFDDPCTIDDFVIGLDGFVVDGPPGDVFSFIVLGAFSA